MYIHISPIVFLKAMSQPLRSPGQSGRHTCIDTYMSTPIRTRMHAYTLLQTAAEARATAAEHAKVPATTLTHTH